MYFIDWKVRYFRSNSLQWLVSIHHFLSGFLFFPWAPLSFTARCCYHEHPAVLCSFSLWHGTFRQTQASLFGQCILLNGPSFIFTHGTFPVPEQLYTWLHLELKEQAESLSPAKEQQHCEPPAFCDASVLPVKEEGILFGSNRITTTRTRRDNMELN